MYRNNDNTFSLKTVDIRIYVLLLLSCLVVFIPKLQNDCFWLIKVGEHIVTNGFPVTEPLTYHTGLYFPVQQWLSAVIFFIIHKYLGFTGLYLLTAVFSLLVSIAIYKLCILLSDGNRAISMSLTLVTNALMVFMFFVPRPQIFSYLIFILEIIFLELYLKKDNYKYLVFLPILSIILINIHAAIWIFFFLLLIPYLFDGIKQITSYLKIPNHTKNKYILLCMIACIICGFINPYGLDNVLYSIKSFGTGTNFIGEMLPVRFNNILGLTLLGYLFFLAAIYKFVNSKTTLRYALITLGTVYMSLLSFRNFALLIICATPFLAYYLRNMRDLELNKISKSILFSYKFISIISLLVVLRIGYIAFNPDITIDSKKILPDKATDFILENIDLDSMKIYNGFNTGGYLEFRGIKTFIDSRAEVFTKNINKKEDILTDDINLAYSKVYYKDIFDKYQFTHWLIDIDSSLNVLMDRDDAYEKIYQDEDFAVYQKASL